MSVRVVVVALQVVLILENLINTPLFVAVYGLHPLSLGVGLKTKTVKQVASETRP